MTLKHAGYGARPFPNDFGKIPRGVPAGTPAMEG